MTHKVLLIITGSVAAYKSLETIRLLQKEGIAVTGVLTAGGAEFITPLSVSSLTGTETYTHLFSLKDEVEMGHIRLSREHDLILVAPASADFIAKMATGRADDLASATLLASSIPVLTAPAMNHKMWAHPATQRNLAQIQADGVALIPPAEGEMACGEEGIGRMAEPQTIADAVRKKLSGAKEEKPAIRTAQPLRGRRALVTSGPTQEAIDPVRYISNHSSGKQGHAIAQALVDAGADVTLISGPVNLPDPQGTQTVRVTTAEEMFRETMRNLPVDIAVCAAAVADWTIDEPAKEKSKKQKGAPRFKLSPTKDILAALAQHPQKRPPLLVGFAAETYASEDAAREKLKRKGCDWLLLNDVSEGKVFGSDRTQLTLITKTDTDTWKPTSKQEAAARLVDKIAQQIANSHKDFSKEAVNITALPSKSAQARHLASLGMPKAEIARQLEIGYAHVTAALKMTPRQKKQSKQETRLAQYTKDSDKIRYLAKEGLTPAKIAGKLGLERDTVKQVLKPRKKSKKKTTTAKVKKKTGIPQELLIRLRTDPNFRTQASRIRHLAGMGVKKGDIARALGVRYQTVYNTLVPQKQRSANKNQQTNR